MTDIRRTATLLRRIFELLDAHPEGLSIRALLEQIDLGVLRDGESGPAEREDTLRGACVAPLNAGWMTVRHGYHLALSDTGRAAYHHFSDPVEFLSAAGRLSVQGRLSLRFPKSYRLAAHVKDRVLAELRAARRIGIRHLLDRALTTPAGWERALPLQAPRRVAVPGLTDALLADLPGAGIPAAQGGHAIYVPPASLPHTPFRSLAHDYPADAGLKIVKHPGAIESGRYVQQWSKGDSQIHLGFVHHHSHLTLVANLLYSHGVGPRLYDLVELDGDAQVFAAYVVEHVAGAMPSMAVCEEGIGRLRALEQQGLIRVILPEGFADEEFECPSCCQNALTTAAGQFRYIDFQNFYLPAYGEYLKRVALAATEASHFGDESVLRGGRYLYQSIPGVDLPAKRRIEARVETLTALLASAGVSLRDRLVLDIGCNIGMMLGQYLRLGARWCHGWDRGAVVPHTEKLLLALGCTRFSLSGGDLSGSHPLEADVPPFLQPRLDGCVVSYLAVRRHLGWLPALAHIPWELMIYEGHEGETADDLASYLRDFARVTSFSVRATTRYADGDNDVRTLAILQRR